MEHDDLERRKHPRATGIVGSAVVLTNGERSGACTVRDLSARGAMLVGALPLAAGDRIEILFEADGDRLTGIKLHAEVVRSERLPGERYTIGVAFREVPATLHDHIQELVVSALERQRANAPPAIMVVDETPQARRAVARDLLGLRQKVVAASTLLDVVRHLHDPDLRIEAALVDTHVGDADGLAILAHLADAHPNIRRVLMSDRSRVRDYERELASGRAHAFLTKPWDRECLVAALSVFIG